MMVNLALILVGIGALYYGGNWTVDGAVALAHRLGVSAGFVGLSLIALGTSLPELVVTLDAVWKGHPDLAMGNIVGSNIANVLFIAGVGALVCFLQCPDGTRMRDLPVFAAVMVLLTGLMLYGRIERWMGLLMVLVLAGYLVWSWRLDRRHTQAEDTEEGLPVLRALGLVLLGLVLLAVGGEVLVTGGVGLARDLGVAEAAIGLSLIAFGTSLPELAATVTAALRKETALALGNVIGSNIYNVLLVLGLTGALVPVPLNQGVLGWDVWLMLGVCLAFGLVVLGWRGVPRGVGGLFLAGYGGYMVSLVLRF